MKKFLSLVLALVMTMSLVTVSAGAKDFTDNSKIAYKEAVDVVSALKIVDGYEDGAFNPTNTLTRGAAAKIICNLILGPTTASALSADTAPYKDVPTNNVFAGYITYCAQKGIISGYADGTFRPAATLTGYAFMKMLLGALDYNAETEKFVGANWSVQVGKTAIGIGLDDGNDDFVGTQAVTREEACLYAFNTLQATMVEYENQSQIVIGDITVNSSSKAKDMANTSKTDGNINKDEKMQFAEKYFTDLKLKSGEDDFARPANVWTLKSNEIGTYAKTPDATYSAEVEVGDIYKDLGLSGTVDKSDVSVYVDGEENDDVSPVAIKKGDDNNKFGANGVLTEVFYDDDEGTVVITEVNTYVGQISKTVKATSKKDAYVEIAALEAAPDNKGLDFETTEEFDDDAYVLYTYSQSADEVKSVADTESVTGTVTKVVNKVGTTSENNKKLTIDGTEYKASKNLSGEEMGDVSLKNDYTVYMDAYGYIIYIEEEELTAQDYALVLASAEKSDFVGKKAELLFADGTSKVVTTEKTYDLVGKIVTYKEDSDGVYTLKEVSSKQTNGTNKTMSVGTLAKNGDIMDGSDTFTLKNDKASVVIGGGKDSVTTNSKTVFVVRDNNDYDDYTSYTGIKNAPTIAAGDLDNPKDQVDQDEKVVVYYFCKSGNMATVMFVFPGDALTVEDDSSKLLYLAHESVSNKTYDNDDTYYEYNAVVNGELKTVKVADDVTVSGANAQGTDGSDLNGLYKSYSTNKYGVITKVTGYDAYKDTDAKVAINGATGIDKKSADYTVILGTKSGLDATITVADDVKVYSVDKDGEITSSSYRSIAKDDDDKVYAEVKDFLVQTLIVETVDKENVYGLDVAAYDNGTVKVDGSTVAKAGKTVDGYDKGDDAVLTVTPDAGYRVKSVKVDGTTVTLNDGGKYTVEDLRGLVTVAVVFEEIPPESMEVIVTYQTSAGVTVADDVVTVDAPATGSVVKVEAKAELVEGYHFVGSTTKSIAFVANGTGNVTFIVAETTLDSIEVTDPSKTNYLTTDTALVLDGMKVEAKYNDGTTVDVTDEAHVDDSAVKFDTAATYTVTVSYEGQSDTFEVVVADAPIV